MRTVLSCLTIALIVAVAVPAVAERPPKDSGSPVGIQVNEIGRYTAPGAEFDDGGAEVVAYDPGTQRLFIANGSQKTVDVVDIADASDPTLVAQVALSEYGDGINGVGTGGGLVGVAVEPEDTQNHTGVAVFIDPATLDVVAVVEAGFLPDAITFSPDASVALVANEGEPDDDYTIDPPGSVTIVDTATFATTQVGFTQFEEGQLDDSVRIFGPDATVAQDLEPENIAFSRNSSTAFVTLQENNAIAIIDVGSATVTDIVGLGFKDWSTTDEGLDASNRDDGIAIRDWPVFGMPQPDGIAGYQVRGQTFLVTANEGDARDYDGFSEEARVKDLELCEDFTYDGMTAEELQADDNLGRLNITTTLGLDEERDCYAALYAYGTRSLSIYSASGDLVADSGSEFEQITAAELGTDGFNADNDEPATESFDSRSDDKGPEPEGVAVGNAYGATYAFVGLERVGGLITYDVSDPTAPAFVDYTTGRDLDAATAEESVDLGPEGVLFIGDEDSPTGRPLVVLAHEVTGSTTIYQLDPVPPARGRR